jgi:hypothetical protein
VKKVFYFCGNKKAHSFSYSSVLSSIMIYLSPLEVGFSIHDTQQHILVIVKITLMSSLLGFHRVTVGDANSHQPLFPILVKKPNLANLALPNDRSQGELTRLNSLNVNFYYDTLCLTTSR